MPQRFARFEVQAVQEEGEIVQPLFQPPPKEEQVGPDGPIALPLQLRELAVQEERPKGVPLFSGFQLQAQRRLRHEILQTYPSPQDGKKFSHSPYAPGAAGV